MNKTILKYTKYIKIYSLYVEDLIFTIGVNKAK